MAARFEDYQLEELVQARAYLVREWGQKRVCQLEPLAVMVLPSKQAATFYGLTHDTQDVCAIVRFADEPFLHRVHYSRLVLV